MENAVLVLLSVMGVIAAIYFVLFFIFPMAGRKKAEQDPLVEMHTIEIPQLSKRAEKILNQIVAYIKKKEKIDLRKNRLAYSRICDAAIKAETELKFRDSVDIRIPGIAYDNTGPINLELTIFRDLLDGK
jgi:hypothetical protein